MINKNLTYLFVGEKKKKKTETQNWWIAMLRN